MAVKGVTGDIAVIGMSCRFPGEAKSPDDFFEMLLNGRSGLTDVPKERFNIDSWWHPSYDRHGTVICRGGYFLEEDVGLFDAPFFSMTSTEADAMDPQHRLLLEVAYESLENAGIPTQKIVGSETSCYVGGFTKDYEKLSNLDQADTLLYSTTGNGLTMMSNRLSWFFDLRGGSMTIDTACSSSLVALHQACLDIRTSSRKTRQAIVAGVNLVLAPDMMAVLNPLHFLSPDSKCYSFDERANGYARGDGVGVLILKHVDDAIRDNDCIRAIIRGTGINQDGKTPGIALPSSEAQMSLIKETYEAFNIPLNETSYFEAHGTGTPAGDSMEINAIASVFDRTGPGAPPLFIGTCKPNIGHVEGAAGVAGLIKTILALERGIIPPNINFIKSNPKLRLDERNFKVPTKPTPWPNSGTRRASVNSFGYGGTNAHCILEDAYHYLSPRGLGGRTRTIEAISIAAPDPDGYDSGVSFGDEIDTLMSNDMKKRRIIVISTPDQAALPRLAKRHADYLNSLAESQDGLTEDILDNLAFTYNCRRSFFQWRTAFVTSSISDLAKQFSDISAPLRAGKPPGILFAFTGQGAQWHAMGRELMIYDVYRESVETADSYLSSIGASWSVVTELFRDEKETNINQQKYSQPLCAIVQMALVDLLRHWEIRPKIVVGHSSGEIAAAYTVGALTAEDCWKLAYHRGRLCSDLKNIAPNLKGTMLAVGLSSKEIEPYVEKLALSKDDVLSIACYNSPSSITMTGDVEAVKKLEAELKSANIFCRLLKVDNAYHSEHIRNIQELLRKSISDIKSREGDPDVLIISSATGEPVQAIDLDVDYWVQHTVTPVRFDAAMASALQAGKSSRRKGAKVTSVNAIIEIGPHSALQGPIKQILDSLKKKESVSYASTLIRGQSAVDTSFSMAGSLWCRGFDVSLQNVNSPSKIHEARIPVSDLPKYPWNHEHKYWHEGTLSRSVRFRTAPRTDLLGEPVMEFSRKDPAWKNFVRLSETPWLIDHKIKDNIIFPATGMICAALEGAIFLADKSRTIKSYEFRDIKIGRALMIPISDPGIEVFTKLRPRAKLSKDEICETYDFVYISLEMSAAHDLDQTEHASGTVTIIYQDYNDNDGLENEKKRADYQQAYQNALTECLDEVTAEAHYDLAKQKGIEYGPVFQGLKSAKNCNGKATFVLEIQDTKSTMPANYEFPLILHPTTLDSAMQTALQALESQNRTDTLVPSGFDTISIMADIPNKPSTELVGFATANWTGFNDASADISISIEGWPSTMITIGNMTLTSLGDGSNQTDNDDQELSMRKLAAKQLWKPAIDLLDSKRHNSQSIFARDIVGPEEMTTCSSAATKTTAIYIKRALMFMTPEVEAHLSDHAIKMVSWMRERNETALAGKLDYQEESGEDWLNMSFEDEERHIEDGIEQYPEYGIILRKIGRNLPHILAGTLQPLQYMLENDMLSKLFTEGMVLKAGLQMFERWFDLQGHKHPDMKILEVGGGTGSITLPILKILSEEGGSVPRFNSYSFTDITSGWFDKAEERFKDWKAWMEYKTLDIEKDPLQQEFPLESFDVLAASNVLHATKRLQTTLSNCLNLLKPGGKIVIGEMTYKSDHDSLMFGTLPGWWLSEDGREGSPLITQEEWKKNLLDAGFASVDDPVAAYDVHGRPLISMIVGHKPLNEPEKSLSKVIIVKPIIQSDIGDQLVTTLQERYASSGTAIDTISLEDSSRLTESVDSDCVVLSLVEAFDPVLARCNEEQFEAIRTLILSTEKLMWVSCLVSSSGVREPDACAISGLLRSVKSESPSLTFSELHLRKRDVPDLHEAVDIILDLVHKLRQAENPCDVENEIVEIDGMLQIPRIFDDVPMNKVLQSLGREADPEPQPLIQESRPLRMTIGSPGALDSLYFVDDPVHETSLPVDEVEIEVKANSLNLNDILVATGQSPGFNLGIDAAGIVVKVGSSVERLKVGDRVTFMQPGSMRTTVRIHSKLAQKLPDSISYEDGAAIPLPFVAAYRSLVEVAGLLKGESVLIQTTAGGLGHALIVMAQQIGARIFITVDSEAQKEIVLRDFEISPDHIFDSRCLNFAHGVKRMTDGQGVDVVVTSLSGEVLRAAWDCISPFGRLVSLQPNEISDKISIETKKLTCNVTFSTVNPLHLIQEAPFKAASLLEKVFDTVQLESLKLPSVVMYDYSDAESAFRHIQNGDAKGPLILSGSEKSTVNVVPRDEHPLEFHSNATYVLAGGLGGLGRALAIYMAQHGAKHIVFLSRSGATRPEAQAVRQELIDLGVQAAIFACDIADRASVATTMENISQDMPPVKGVIHAAMVVRDGTFKTMTYEDWNAAARPKIDGTWNLHELVPKDLDFFLTLSSVSGIVGNRGQSSYSAGNSYQDALMYYRHSLGLPATTIDLGAIGGMGWLEENKEASTYAKWMVRLTINPEEFFTLFKSAITGFSHGNCALPAQLMTALGNGGLNKANVEDLGLEFWWLNDSARFTYLRELDLRSFTSGQDQDSISELKDSLKAVTNLAGATDLIVKALAAKLARGIMIPAEEIDVNMPISSYGVDSLVAADFRNWCFKELKADIQIFEFLSNIPLTALGRQITEKSTLVPDTVARS